MCRDHHGERRCSCCDPDTRRARRREGLLRERGYHGPVDEAYAAASVPTRTSMATDHPEAVHDRSPTVRAAAAARADLSDDDQEQLASDDRPGVRRALAANEHVDPGVLDTLSYDPDLRVRQTVADNPGTPPEVLAAMASEVAPRRDTGIIRTLARNSTTPSSALEAWAKSGTETQRQAARAALQGRTAV